MKKHNWTPVLYLHESEGNTKIKLKKISLFFNFQKIGSEGSVKRKIKELWPKAILNVHWVHVQIILLDLAWCGSNVILRNVSVKLYN